MSVSEFTSVQRTQMLAMARSAITAILNAERPDVPSVDDLPDWLKPLRACFVTLESHKRLRGCIGSLDAHRPLGQDIILNAVSAVTRDHRFAPLQPGDPVRISLSVLSPLTPLPVSSETELLAVLQPGRDGVVLQAGEHRATFLPVVWQSLSTPEAFISELKRKAGLPSDYWSDNVRIWRYHTDSFGEEREMPVVATGTC
jgi:AmmeMemoRadiSam system protein A